MNKKCSLVLSFFAYFAVLLITGCAEPTAYPEIVKTTTPFKTTRLVLPDRLRILGRSVQNRPITYQVLGNGPDVTFILAAIHGNEPAGVPLVRRLADHLRQNQHLLKGHTVVLLPVANPDGLARSSRYNANGVDLNRNFSAANRINSKQTGYSALSEPEARTIQQIIRQYSPDRIVSIHQPLACIDYDGPAYGLAVRMGQYCPLPVKKLGAKPGSLGSYAGVTLRIPIVTLEMLKSDSTLNSERLWQRYGKALLAAVAYPSTAK